MRPFHRRSAPSFSFPLNPHRRNTLPAVWYDLCAVFWMWVFRKGLALIDVARKHNQESATFYDILFGRKN
jgi:hypothetical protein